MFVILLLACATEYAIVADFPKQGDNKCLATPLSELSPIPGTDRYAGWSVAFSSTGPRAGILNASRWAVVGAPGDPYNEESGFVSVVSAGASDGLLDPTHASNRVLRAPSAAPSYHFGWSVLASDVRECHLSSQGREDACGDELLVGAPDLQGGGTRGRVFWYMTDGDNTDGVSAAPPYAWAGTLNPPGTYALGSEFGYALAAPRHPTNPDQPWDTAGSPPAWVAISAPGAGKVLIYAVNWANPAPFTLAQELVAPDARRHFGHSLAVGDFDGDGLDDLAVGAPLPGTVLEGRVYVFRGQLGAQPINGQALTLDGQALSGSARGGVEEDSFGWAMAAGPFVAGQLGDGLMVGAPRSGSDDDGGVCQFTMRASGAGLGLVAGGCWVNRFRSATNTPASAEHMGWSLAVGNFHNNDDLFQDDTAEALAPEVAIGRPGHDASRGAVDVFMTDRSGYVWSEFATSLTRAPASTPGARYGAAIAGGYVQRSHWMDLLVGAPYASTGRSVDGLAQLSKATESSACTEITATWEATDSEGDPVLMQVFQVDGASAEVHVLLLEPYNMGAFEDFGGAGERLCTTTVSGPATDASFFLPRGMELSLPGQWICGATSQTWTGVDASPILGALGLNLGSNWTMDVTLDYDSANGTLELDIQSAQISAALLLAQLDDPACMLEPLPFEMSLISSGVCE